MSNPRPCEVCRSPKSEHDDPEAYKPAPRTEPLRARRDAWSLERMQEVMRSTGYTPRVENTYHLRAERVPQPGHVPEPSEPSVPVRVLREFINAEYVATNVARSQCDELRDRYYYSGVANGLGKVGQRFCGDI